MNEKTISELRTKVYEAVGESSMTWCPIPSGIYDSTRAKGIGDRLMDEILSRFTTTENKGGDKEGYWWCQHCVREVHPQQVTYEENHANCGARVEWRTDTDRPASPTKADKVESLAELADRKGKFIHGISLVIGDRNCGKSKSVCGVDSREAESKARAFLTALDDVTGKGGR